MIGPGRGKAVIMHICKWNRGMKKRLSTAQRFREEMKLESNEESLQTWEKSTLKSPAIIRESYDRESINAPISLRHEMNSSSEAGVP